jgi:hypothetical protein
MRWSTDCHVASLLTTIACFSVKIVVGPGHNHLKGYEIGVAIAVTPILSLGFCGAKSDARYDCGQRKLFPINSNSDE